MSALSIRLLGPPQVDCAGAPLQVDTRKAVALLARLAMDGGAVPRDSLATLLWPDYDPERARASLRRTLSALVKALGGRWVVADRRTVRLERDGVHVDVERFHELLGAAAAEQDVTVRRTARAEAAALYRGDFLAGFVLRDSPEFDDWQFFTAESLRRELALALEALVEDCLHVGALHEAIGHARRWLALDPLHEPAHRALMSLYAWTDQRGPALRQFRECVRVLHRELGVAPVAATQELARAIKEHRLPRPAPAAAPAATLAATPAASGQPFGTAPADLAATPPGAARPTAPAPPPAEGGIPPAVRAHPPLVGREAALAALLDGIAAAGGGWVGAVEGEAGIGRSRLLEELRARAGAAGATTVLVRCFEGEEHLPYGPFVAAIRELLGDPAAARRLEEAPPSWWAEAGRLLPEVAARAGGAPALPPDDPGAQARLLDALSGILLTGLGGTPPGLLLIDDAHWADQASLGLLAFASRRLGRGGAGIALAWRGDAVPLGHPLRRVLREAPVAATHVLPARLSRDEVDHLADALHPGGDAATRARLWEETEGVPLFVVEVLAALAAGADATGWAGAGSVRELLASRVAGLDEAAGQLLATAAVIGRSFGFAVLRDASGRSEEETVAGLEVLLARGLLREEPGERGEPRYDFTHHQLRAHVLATTSLARRRLLHRRVATALEAGTRGRRGTAALRAQIAWHLQEGGDDEAAAEHYARAGHDARAVHANAEALAHLEAALALGHPDQAGLHAAIGDLATLAGRYEEAVRRYETAAAVGGPEDLAAVEHRLAGVHQRLGEWEVAETHLRSALSLLGEDAAAGLRARVLADASLVAHRRGDADRARELALQVLPLAEGGGDAALLGQAHNLLGLLATADGDPVAAVDHLERSLAVATDLHDLPARAGALNNLALAHRAAGATDVALPLAEEAVALSRQVDDRHRLAAATGNLADLLRDAGRLPEAEARVREAVEILAAMRGEEPRPGIWQLVDW